MNTSELLDEIEKFKRKELEGIIQDLNDGGPQALEVYLEVIKARSDNALYWKGWWTAAIQVFSGAVLVYWGLSK